MTRLVWVSVWILVRSFRFSVCKNDRSDVPAGHMFAAVSCVTFVRSVCLFVSGVGI